MDLSQTISIYMVLYFGEDNPITFKTNNKLNILIINKYNQINERINNLIVE